MWNSAENQYIMLMHSHSNLLINPNNDVYLIILFTLVTSPELFVSSSSVYVIALG